MPLPRLQPWPCSFSNPGPTLAYPSSNSHRSPRRPNRSSIQSRAAVRRNHRPQVAGGWRGPSSRCLCRPYGPLDLFDSALPPASFPEPGTLPSLVERQRPRRRRWRPLLALTWYLEEDSASPTRSRWALHYPTAPPVAILQEYSRSRYWRSLRARLVLRAVILRGLTSIGGREVVGRPSGLDQSTLVIV